MEYQRRAAAHLSRCRAFVDAEWAHSAQWRNLARWLLVVANGPRPRPAGDEAAFREQAARHLAARFPFGRPPSYAQYVALHEPPPMRPPVEWPPALDVVRRRWVEVHYPDLNRGFARLLETEQAQRRRARRSAWGLRVWGDGGSRRWSGDADAGQPGSGLPP